MVYAIIFINISYFYLIYKDKLSIDDLSASYYDVFVRKQYKRLLTAGFAHGGILHIFFNMYSFYSIARIIERLYGSIGFLIIYLVIMVLAQILSLIAKHNSRNDYASSIGASGAIIGLIGIYFVKMFLMFGTSAFSMFLPLLLNIIIMSLLPGIDFTGHLFGFVVGGIIGFIL